MAYDNKFKKRAIEYKEEGHSIRETGKVFGISPNTLNTWIQQYRKDGKTSRKKRGYNHKITEQKLMAYLEDKPDSYPGAYRAKNINV